MKYKFLHLNKTYTIKIEKSGGNYTAVVDNTTYEVADFAVQQNAFSFKLDNKLCSIYFVEDKGKIHLVVDGEYCELELEKEKAVSARRPVLQKGNSVASPMPGLLVKMPVAKGDKVAAGTTLAIVEAMKMQNELRAPRDGVVKKINYKEGEQVDALKPIVELEILIND
ncbi:hypothetical protein KAS56_05080 [candidate division WOR-3 bacterium]|nr:hypothetical protein [candidate division WOR-3 bacterium]